MDGTPYPRVLQPSWPEAGFGIHLTKQDEKAATGDFPLVRRLIAHGEGDRGYHVGLELWRKPPREYPPMHIGDTTVGIRLDAEEAAALWASLGEWLVAQSDQA